MFLQVLSEFDFHHRLAAAPGVSLVLFTAPDCGSCRMWLHLLEGFSSPLLQNGYVVDVAVATALANEYEVFHLPSLFLFADGKFHAPLHAEALPAALHQAIADTLNCAPQEEP
ncbi:MAG TPA: protein disulfide isomerase family protein [Burkholderiales bacterium]|nr:protein disulfide isomerase family protein [Burkholderiales bacterium]